MISRDSCRLRVPLPSLFALSIATLVPGHATHADEPAVGQNGLGTLEVRVTGFKTDAGRLAIALFANEEDYATQSNAVRRAWIEIENGESRWEVGDLPEGSYALIAYQDVNGNQKIDMRAFGMPKEPVGVSNDARGLFGPPRFNAAEFELRAPLTRNEFKLR
jgi:uncharacterized protein (DUF2141 family)